MKLKDKVLLVVIAILCAIGIWMVAHTIADHSWYVGKTYGSETDSTLSEEEVLSSINEEIAETHRQMKPHDDWTRIAPHTTEAPTTEEPTTVTEAPTEAPTPAPTKETKVNTGIIHYSIDGTMMDPVLQDILYTTLREAGMDWWMPYAIAQARAESGAMYSQYAVSKDGKDKGLFQYREKYWNAKAERAGLHNADIFNPVNQIYVYCYEVTSRYKAGITDIGQLISAHKTAGVGYDAAYVDYVMGFVAKLQIVR